MRPNRNKTNFFRYLYIELEVLVMKFLNLEVLSSARSADLLLSFSFDVKSSFLDNKSLKN